MEQYSHNVLFARKEAFRFRCEIRIYDRSGSKLLFFVKQTALKLKEEITVHVDAAQTRELLNIQAQNIIDFPAAYDVTDSTSNQKVGALRRRGLGSVVRDRWEIMDAAGKAIGTILEDNLPMAVLRRFLPIIPRTYKIEINGTVVGVLKQSLNPLVLRLWADFSMDTENKLDRRLGIAALSLLHVIDGRQQ